jgi:glycosyltransferase involved in cell wall biosynthesis
MAIDFSIVLCFYNAKVRLEKTLLFLSKLDIENLGCELILVDNNSTDNGAEFAKHCWNKYGSPYPLKLIVELQPGVANARKAGCNHANGEYILFCDDDNWIDSQYLRKANRLLKDMPKVGILGGTGTAISDISLPIWLDLFKELYAVGNKTENGGYVEVLPSAGMVINTELLRDYYQLCYSRFDGRIGKQYYGGEDTAFCLVFTWMGYSVFHSRELMFEHFLPKTRLKKMHLFRLVNGIARSQPVMEGLRTLVNGYRFKPLHRIIRDLLWILSNFSKVISPKYRLWFFVWTYYRINFWKQYLLNYQLILHARQLKFWMNTESAVFTKYSQRSEKPFAGL